MQLSDNAIKGGLKKVLAVVVFCVTFVTLSFFSYLLSLYFTYGVESVMQALYEAQQLFYTIPFWKFLIAYSLGPLMIFFAHKVLHLMAIWFAYGFLFHRRWSMLKSTLVAITTSYSIGLAIYGVAVLFVKILYPEADQYDEIHESIFKLFAVFFAPKMTLGVLVVQPIVIPIFLCVLNFIYRASSSAQSQDEVAHIVHSSTKFQSNDVRILEKGFYKSFKQGKGHLVKIIAISLKGLYAFASFAILSLASVFLSLLAYAEFYGDERTQKLLMEFSSEGVIYTLKTLLLYIGNGSAFSHMVLNWLVLFLASRLSKMTKPGIIKIAVISVAFSSVAGILIHLLLLAISDTYSEPSLHTGSFDFTPDALDSFKPVYFVWAIITQALLLPVILILKHNLYNCLRLRMQLYGGKVPY
ncbi:MAG: hypothetical protein KatS3mg030_551 [Saprospiraceae bacterium]|nr:MAG: hypothetical protein KatS3mg030_551 [Saprospiraceae bacterium]